MSDQMKCYEYCQALFDEIFLPVLKEKHSEILPRLSVGVIGQGSEVLGADDELSRDHDWGPMKCQLLLPEKDVVEYGTSISQALGAVIPDEFRGITISQPQSNSLPISTIDAAYENLCDFAHPPVTNKEWASIDDSSFCYASSGFVIYDPSEALSNRISEFQAAYYPIDIWRWKLAQYLWGLWHNGDYNIRMRLTKRGDGVGLLIGQGAFVEGVLGVACLLNKRFPVYWKWLHWQFQQLPKWRDELAPQLQALDAAANHEIRGEIIGSMCDSIRKILQEEGFFPDTKWRMAMGGIDILKQIESNEVREIIRNQTPHLYVW